MPKGNDFGMSRKKEETEFEWTAYSEFMLLYSLYLHQPVVPGRRHFVMLAVWEHFTKSIGVEVPISTVKEKLNSYYNFDAAARIQDKKFDFPTVEFSLPSDEFPELMEE